MSRNDRFRSKSFQNNRSQDRRERKHPRRSSINGSTVKSDEIEAALRQQRAEAKPEADTEIQSKNPLNLPGYIYDKSSDRYYKSTVSKFLSFPNATIENKSKTLTSGKTFLSHLFHIQCNVRSNHRRSSLDLLTALSRFQLYSITDMATISEIRTGRKSMSANDEFFAVTRKSSVLVFDRDMNLACLIATNDRATNKPAMNPKYKLACAFEASDHSSRSVVIYDIHRRRWTRETKKMKPVSFSWSLDGLDLFICDEKGIFRWRWGAEPVVNLSNVAAVRICHMNPCPSTLICGMQGGDIKLLDKREKGDIISPIGQLPYRVDHLRLLNDSYRLIAQDITGRIQVHDIRVPMAECRVLQEGDSTSVQDRNFYVTANDNIVVAPLASRSQGRCRLGFWSVNNDNHDTVEVYSGDSSTDPHVQYSCQLADCAITDESADYFSRLFGMVYRHEPEIVTPVGVFSGSKRFFRSS